MTCLSLDRLRTYRRQELPEEEGQLVELHLSECRTCRRILVDDLRREGLEEAREPDPIPGEVLRQVRNLVPAERRRPRLRAWLPLAAVLVAVLGGALLIPRHPPESVLRGDDEISNRLVPIEPTESAEVHGLVRFRWTGASEAQLYRLVILGVDGSRLLERESQQTEVEIDMGSLPAQGEARVYWLVEAQLPGGDRRSSDPRLLTVTAGLPDRSP